MLLSPLRHQHLVALSQATATEIEGLLFRHQEDRGTPARDLHGMGEGFFAALGLGTGLQDLQRWEVYTWS